MKKFLTMVVALILLFSVCSSCITKKENDVYKAKIKQELDSIPPEETGYKLIFNNDSNTWLSIHVHKLEVNGHIYEFDNNEEDFLIVYIDDTQKNTPIKINCSYGEYFKKYTDFFGCYFFDGNIFFIKYKLSDNIMHRVEDFLPPLLFLFNPENQTVKYCGYFEKWFDGNIWDYKNYFSIIKT